MITEITNNPFRILGLPVNANRKEIDHRYHELIVGLDQQEQLPEAIKEIENAYHAVTSSEFHWHHASFWFASISEKDEHAIQYVEENDYESAIDIWESNENYVSIHNLMLCYILMGESTLMYYATAFQYARIHFLIDRNFEPFVECVNEKEKVASNASKEFLDVVFSQTVADKPTLYALLGSKEWMEYVRGKWVDADKADARAEDVRDYINSAVRAKKTEDAEKSRNRALFWLWMLLFPIVLFFYHRCQDSKPKNSDIPLLETVKTNQHHRQIIDMNDSATFNRVHSELKDMKEKSNRGNKSLKEKIEQKRKNIRENKVK